MNNYQVQHRRALYFTGGLLAAMILLGQQFAAWRSNTPLGTEVTLKGWRLTFRAPAGWTEAEFGNDLLGQRELGFADPAGGSVLTIGRLDVTSDTTPETLADWTVGRLGQEYATKPPRNMVHRASRFGPWPARIVEWTEPAESGEGTYEARVLAAIAGDSDEDREGYTVTLLTAGSSTRTRDRIWDSVIDSVAVKEESK